MDNDRVRRKYGVFISSTFKDLHEHREMAINGVIRAKHLPVALEYTAPVGLDRGTVIKEAMRECQFYIIILGYRYGTVPEGGDGRSYTEIELDYAEELGLRVLPFVLDENEVNTLRDGLKNPADKEELANFERYWKLRERLIGGLKNPWYQPFKHATEIWPGVQAILSQPHEDVPGYILEPEDTSDKNILHIYASNEIVRDVVERLGAFENVDPRLTIAHDQKQALADAFLELHGDHVRDKYAAIFLESGSTINYIARRLAGDLTRPRTGVLPTRHGSFSDASRPVVITNNAFAYLYLWLCSGVMCHPEPEGPPDQKYGGMYGPFADRTRRPNYSLPSLESSDPDAVKLLGSVSARVFAGVKEPDRARSLVLAAASGLQLSSNITAVQDKEGRIPYTETEVLEQLQLCRGFHVGSYENKLFKRSLYGTKIPTVVFIHDSKIDCPIQVAKCHFVFDQGEPWDEFVKNYPLSIWVGCRRGTQESVMKLLTENLPAETWKLTVYGASTSFPVLIGHNKAFRDAARRQGITLSDIA